METHLPIFLKNPTTRAILNEIKYLVPEDTKVYVFAGTIRNALYFNFFSEEVTQRDFDCIVIGDGEKFTENLLGAGFIYGNKNSEKAKVLKKARTPEPQHQYDDWLYLDCKIYPSGEIIENILNRISDFTVSGVAMDIEDMEKEDWQERIIAIPHAKEDIQEKRLRVVRPYPISLHKIIRMVSRGFQKPSPQDIQLCIEKLKNIAEDKFAINTEKTIRYVGSKEKVLEIANELGVTFNILDLHEIKNL